MYIHQRGKNRKKPSIRRKQWDLQRLLTDFKDSDALVICINSKKVDYAVDGRSSLYSAVQRYYPHDMIVTQIKDDVYIIKLSAVEDVIPAP